MEDELTERMRGLATALDEELKRQPWPTSDMVEEEIADMRAEAPDLGENPDDTEMQLRQMSASFWRDWFAVDALVEPLEMTEEEVWGLCLAREAARKPRMGPQA